MVDVIVFDFGGVLVKLGGMSKFVSWTGHAPDQVKERWLKSEVVRGFETGRLSYESFAQPILAEFSIPFGIQGARGRDGWMAHRAIPGR